MSKFQLNFLRWLIRIAVRFNWRGKRATEVDVHDETVPVAGGSIRVRVYRPRGDGPFPILHFFHGGGWIGFDIDTHDPLCRDLCVQARYLVLSFEYRLAPENPFPIPVEDCLVTLGWTRDNARRLGGDLAHMVVGGDSAGGNLAAIAVQQARRLHPGLVNGQLLIYPVTDHSSANWPSYVSKGGPKAQLTHEKMSQMWKMYLGDSPLWPLGTTSHDLATPLHVADLKGLPPALVILAIEDLLHDEGAAYAQRLREAGTLVEVREYPGEVHGFVGLKPTPGHRLALTDMATWLKSLANPASKQ